MLLKLCGSISAAVTAATDLSRDLFFLLISFAALVCGSIEAVPPCLTPPKPCCRPASLPVVADLWSPEERGGGLHGHVLSADWQSCLHTCLSAQAQITYAPWMACHSESQPLNHSCGSVQLEPCQCQPHSSSMTKAVFGGRGLCSSSGHTCPHPDCCCCAVHVPGSREESAASEGDSGWASC